MIPEGDVPATPDGDVPVAPGRDVPVAPDRDAPVAPDSHAHVAPDGDVPVRPDREIYAGRVVTLRLSYLQQPDGTLHLREIVEHVPGAAVVAIDADGQVLLVRQLRPAVGTRLLELPAGLVDPGEQPIDTARRELTEETGFTADHLEPLVSFYTSPGFSTELIHIFVATQLREQHAEPDIEEDIELVRMPLEPAIDLVLNGELSDAKTVAGLLAYKNKIRLQN